MPLFSHKTIKPEGEFGIWEIRETAEWFRHRLNLSSEELEQFELIKGRRAIEWLAVRHLVHQMSGHNKRTVFLKDKYGKPHLDNSPYQISVSHSAELAAAIAAPRPVGIDIQKLVGKIGRLAHKYMRPEEMASLRPETQLEHLHVYWGAKEVLYKAYGRRELEFCTHILIDPFEYDLEYGRCRGRVRKNGFDAAYELYYEMIGEYVLVYGLETDIF